MSDECEGNIARPPKTIRNEINCDQVIWLQNALTRYAQLYHSTHAISPRIARDYADCHQVGCILEIMDVLGLKAKDKLAEGNILAGIKSRIPMDKTNTRIEGDGV